MGRIMSFGQDGQLVRDFDKSEHDFLRRYGRTPDEVMAENDSLRELVDYMTPIAWYAASERERDRMRELGVSQ